MARVIDDGVAVYICSVRSRVGFSPPPPPPHVETVRRLRGPRAPHDRVLRHRSRPTNVAHAVVVTLTAAVAGGIAGRVPRAAAVIVRNIVRILLLFLPSSPIRSFFIISCHFFFFFFYSNFFFCLLYFFLSLAE